MHAKPLAVMLTAGGTKDKWLEPSELLSKAKNVLTLQRKDKCAEPSELLSKAKNVLTLQRKDFGTGSTKTPNTWYVKALRRENKIRSGFFCPWRK